MDKKSDKEPSKKAAPSAIGMRYVRWKPFAKAPEEKDKGTAQETPKETVSYKGCTATIELLRGRCAGTIEGVRHPPSFGAGTLEDAIGKRCRVSNPPKPAWAQPASKSPCLRGPRSPTPAPDHWPKCLIFQCGIIESGHKYGLTHPE